VLVMANGGYESDSVCLCSDACLVSMRKVANLPLSFKLSAP